MRTGQPDFFDLPWEVALAEWPADLLVDVPRGISRHEVRFVAMGDELFAVKELPERYARNDYRMLRRLEEESVPAARGVGYVAGRVDERTGDPLDGAVITRYLEYSLPYRLLFAREQQQWLTDALMGGLVDLLVRLHLTGFFWGDCSLSNTLFRRDAGTLAAYFLDAETTSWHPELTDGQRNTDIEYAVERIAGELFDLSAAGVLADFVDPIEFATSLPDRYEALWDELTRVEYLGDGERFRIDERLERLNDLGYDVGEIDVLESDRGRRLKVIPRIVEPGRHHRLLRSITGIDASESLARRLLNDIHSFGAWYASARGRSLPLPAMAGLWMEMAYLPALDAIPDDLGERREEPQLFHEILEHRDNLAQERGHDVSNVEAATSYVEHHLPHRTVERFGGGESEADEALAGLPD